MSTKSVQTRKVTKSALAELHDDDLVEQSATAAILHVSGRTLENWRSLKKFGPPWVQLGRNIRYRVRDIREYIDRCTHRPEEN